MRWQLTTGWPVGQWLVPADTILIAGSSGGAITSPPIWNGTVALPIDNTRPAPIDAIALDQEASNLMKQWYGPNLMALGGPDMRPWLRRGPGVV
jgi:hypothetical protein